MRLTSAFERIQELIGLIDLDPSIKQVVRFLSTELDPRGEISGVGWMELNSDGVFDYKFVSGLQVTLDPSIKVALSDDNAVALSLRTRKSQIFDMRAMFEQFRQATHEQELSQYASGVILPISEKAVLACAVNTAYEELVEYKEYFECVRLVLALWQSKLFLRVQPIGTKELHGNSQLTARQKFILERIKSGKTNAAIARELGFSESLIRQETIIIYSKLGVSGRNEITGDSV